MTKKFVRSVSIVIVILIVVFCFSLPVIVTKFRDLRQINTINIVDIQPIYADIDSKDSMAKKISIVKNDVYDESVQILGYGSGARFTMESAVSNVAQQIQRLYDLGLLPEKASEYIDKNNNLNKIFILGIKFAFDETNPSYNLILWDVQAISDEYTLNMKIDDETGKVLAYSVSCDNVNKWSNSIDFDSAVEKWAEYLGMSHVGEIKSVYGNKAKAYIKSTDNPNLYSEKSKSETDEMPRLLTVNLQDDGEIASYYIYKDKYQLKFMAG